MSPRVPHVCVVCGVQVAMPGLCGEAECTVLAQMRANAEREAGEVGRWWRRQQYEETTERIRRAL